MKTTYLVYFELYGKKMKTLVAAEDENKAKDIVCYAIKFDEVIEQTKSGNDFMKMFNDIVNGKK